MSIHNELFETNQYNQAVEARKPRQSLAQEGDIWKLADSYLYCAKSTTQENLDKLVAIGGQFDLILTDPPYAIGANKDNSRHSVDFNGVFYNRDNEKNPEYDYVHFEGEDDTQAAADFYSLIKNHKRTIIFGGNNFEFLPHGQWLIWDKMRPPKQSFFADGEMMWTNIKIELRFFRYLWHGYKRCEPDQRYHYCQKPISLLQDIITRFSKEGETVLDGFLGSGSTIIAAHKAKRRCIGFECMPYYCDVILERFKDHTNIKPELVQRTISQSELVQRT